jgi:hypothetical protein
LNHEYMGSTGAPPAAWQGPEDREELRQQPIQETASHTEILTPPIAEYECLGSGQRASSSHPFTIGPVD